MTDSLKFGPEWLRQLSQDNSGSQVVSATSSGVGGGGGGPHPYQLAEHRYGREEMLALFDRLAVARSGPDLLLRSFPTLYVEKAQLPLALVQMTEEETRTWQRGINSESVLRGPGKMGVGGPGSLRGAGGAGGMGRGSVSMDRGVRGRGRGSGGFYTRGSYEEEGGGDGSGGGHWRRGGDSGSGGGGGTIGGSMSSSSSFNSRVTRSFDRSQSGVSERGWGERNGTVDSNDWNGSTSPRKDFGRGLMENWRARGSTEEGDTWRVTNRTEKWGRNSWREGGSGSADQDGVGGGRSWESGEGGGSHHRGRGGGWEEGATNHRPNLHRHSWEESDKLPEWATENLSESGGSFDASGAFHGGGGYSDEDEKGHGKDRPEGMRRLQQSLGPVRRNSGSRGGGNEGTRGPILLRTVSESEADHLPSTVPVSGGGPSRSVSGHMSERSASSEVSSSPEGSKGSPLSTKQETTSSPNSNNSSPPSAPTAVVLSKSSPPHSPSGTSQETQPRPEATRLGPTNKTQSQTQMRASSVPAATNSQINSLSLEGTVASLEARGQQRQRSEEDLERMQEVADDLVAKLMDEEEDEVEIRESRGSGVRQAGNKEDVGGCREEPQGDAARLGQVPGTTGPPEDPTVSLSDKWFYQDPQGIVQGPFGSGEMADWFRAGYFNTTLLVRRACDECFSQLGDLIKHWGCIPFAPGPSPPPLKAPMTDPAIAAASAPLPLVTGAPGSQVVSGSAPVGSMAAVNPAENLLMQQYQYQLIQRELFMRQQAALQAVMEKLSLKNQQSFVQQLMTGSQGQQPPPQGPQQQNPAHQPHHTSTDGMTFIQQPFKMQSDIAAQKNPVMALINQIQQQQQAKVSQPPDGLMAPPINQTPKVVAPDQISQLIQHIAMQQQQQQPQQQASHQSNAGVPHHQQQRANVEPARPPSPVSSVPGSGTQQPPGGAKQENDPFQSIMRLLEGRSNGNPLAAQPPVESVWGGPFAVQNWLAQAAAASGQVAAPPGQHLSQGLIPGAGTPLSLWDLQGKDVKTEQQILEEQMRAEEERKKEELRKQEEAAAKKKVEEEERKRKQLEEELRRKEEERRRLEEQMRQLEEEKRAEEQRRKEEEKHIAEERRRIEEMKQNLIAAEEKKLQEAKRLAEKQKREEAEERKRKEEEEARKQREEEEEKLKKKQEEERKKLQQIEENNRKLENQRRQLEAQRKAQEMQQNAVAAAQAAAAAAQAAVAAASNAAASQRPPKSQAPWAQQQNSANMQNSSVAVTNLAEIQRMQEEEKEKLAQKMREREKELALAQAHAEKEHNNQTESVMHAARPTQQAKSGTSIQLKWADKRPQPVGPVKSLAEIQAEEHEQQLAREREKAERAAQQAQAAGAGGGSQGHGGSSNAPVGGIWGSATQSLTWAARSAGHGGWAAAAAVGAAGTQINHTPSAPTNSSHPVQYGSTGLSSSSSSNSSSSNSSPAVWANTGQNSWATNSVASNATSGGGFWEEPVPAQNAKLGGKAAAVKAVAPTPAAGGKGKGKSRKDEVMKIFEQNVQRSISAGDEFTQWCLKTLGNLQTSVDIPTFVGFLKDIDSPYEVSDYVRSYLGDGKEAREFARNFLERRSRWRNAQKAAAAPPSEDDMCIPAPAVNPLSSEFQEVKGKGKKAKKNKMLKLDNRILGFSVTASHDRINVGDRDYGEGV